MISLPVTFNPLQEESSCVLTNRQANCADQWRLTDPLQTHAFQLQMLLSKFVYTCQKAFGKHRSMHHYTRAMSKIQEGGFRSEIGGFAGSTDLKCQTVDAQFRDIRSISQVCADAPLRHDQQPFLLGLQGVFIPASKGWWLAVFQYKQPFEKGSVSK